MVLELLKRTRHDAKARARALFEATSSNPNQTANVEVPFTKEQLAPSKGLAQLLFEANMAYLSPHIVIGCCCILGASCAVLGSKFLSPYLLPFVCAGAAYLPISHLQKLAQKRAMEFLEDYPTILLAASSSIKAGLTVPLALERAVKLLPSESMVRKEVETLLANLNAGIARDEAIERFAASIRLPELALFRSAFSLVSEHGGKFAPTLHRIALVSRERATLIGSARVSTASMRMTGNFLLFVTPLLVLMVSSRTDKYWHHFFHHPVASVLSSIGIVVVLGCYVLLRKMSDFKP